MKFKNTKTMALDLIERLWKRNEEYDHSNYKNGKSTGFVADDVTLILENDERLVLPHDLFDKVNSFDLLFMIEAYILQTYFKMNDIEK